MPKARLTAGRIRDFALPEGAQQSFLWDDAVPQLAVRVTKGAKAFTFESRIHGSKFRMTIGAVVTWGIDAARDEARRLQTLVDQGIDPRLAKADQLSADLARREAARALREVEARQQITMEEAWRRYLAAREPRWKAHHQRDHHVAERGALAVLMPLRLVDLTPDRLTSWIEAEGADRPASAALAFRLLRAFVNWCASQPATADLIDPAALLTRSVRERIPKPRARDDCLQREQLPAWFAAVRQIGNPVIAAFLQALLLTGARREELGTLTWPDLDFRWASLTIKDKVEGERTIPLTPYVGALLAPLPRRNQWVFSSPQAASGRVAEPRIAHNKALQIAGLPHLTVHGLRRSFGTLSEWVEMPVGVSAQIMGHKPSALAEKHYRRRPLDLLRKWHTTLEAWILKEAGVEFEEERFGLRVIGGGERG